MEVPKNDEGALERQVRPWLEKRGIPIENYRNLPPSYKVWLHDQVCTQTYTLSDRQSGDLYRKLVRPESRKGDSNNPGDDEERRKFFLPLTPSETLSDWEKY